MVEREVLGLDQGSSKAAMRGLLENLEFARMLNSPSSWGTWKDDVVMVDRTITLVTKPVSLRSEGVTGGFWQCGVHWNIRARDEGQGECGNEKGECGNGKCPIKGEKKGRKGMIGCIGRSPTLVMGEVDTYSTIFALAKTIRRSNGEVNLCCDLNRPD
ncbi:hypothetical protein VNO78_34317 [Psophocarpus tetragonolobus]|uniref:Uncharacterized protein n=1 Tax=Psophocarpus tetragonolobus TaxID=3891 RepID=A0AAN9NVS7_PSOTE